MTIPKQSSIELPLLLELERAGGSVTPREAYPLLEKHFPDLTEADKVARRKSGSLIWENLVNWSRNRLREHGYLSPDQPGVWQITPMGQRGLRSRLTEIGVEDPEEFIAARGRSLVNVGNAWNPQPAEGSSAREIESGPSMGDLDASPEIQGRTGQNGRNYPESENIYDALLARLRLLAPAQFEILVARFLEAKGFMDIRVTGRTNDGGIDVEAGIPFIGIRVAVQAKRYAAGNGVGIEPVQRLRGSMASGFDRGIFITTSTFSSAAVGWVEEFDAPITLVDGKKLVRELVGLGIGVRSTPVVYQQVDDEFFQALAPARARGDLEVTGG